MTLTKSGSTKILKDEFAIFDHLFQELIHAKNSFEFFQLIANTVVPLIREVEAYSPLYHEWMTQRHKYNKQYLQFESDAEMELYGICTQIKKTLEKENLLENQDIHQRLAAVEQILDSQKTSHFPSHVEAAYRQIRSLLYDLLKLNHTEIVAHFAQITFLDEATVDKTTQEITHLKSPAIEQFTFAPSLTQLHCLHNQFSWDQVDEAWIAWEYLTLAEQCWKTDEPPPLEESENNAFYLNFRAFCSEMQTIKNGSANQLLFFQRERFIYYLKIIHHELILYQEMRPKEITEPFPYAMSLELPFNKLILKVEWIKESDPESYLVHKFSEESEPCQFTKKLLNSSPNIAVFLKSSSASIPKFLERIKLKNILARLFFTNRTSISLALRSKYVKLCEYPDVNLKELRKEIESLEKVSIPTALAWINTTKSGKTA